MFEREWREASFVPRFGVARTLRTQYLAEHMYYVTVYALQVADLIGYTDAQDVLNLARLCLVHDRPEFATSDIPSPVKAHLGPVANAELNRIEHEYVTTRFADTAWWGNMPKSVSGDEAHKIMAVADAMDAVFYCCTEQQMGNRTLGCLCSQDIVDCLLKPMPKKVGENSVAQMVLVQLARAWFSLPKDEDWLREKWRSVIMKAILSHLHGRSDILDPATA